MQRRNFIALLGGAAAAWPFTASAQSAKPVIGFLRNTSADTSANYVAAFRQGLNEVGYVEGQNLAIEYRWSEGRDERLPTLAAELVRRPVAVFVAANNTALVAAKAATETIPIVFVTGDDPVQLGFVTSLSRPAGNITGVSFYSGTLGAKQVEFLHEIVPKVTAIGILINPNNPAADQGCASRRPRPWPTDLRRQITQRERLRPGLCVPYATAGWRARDRRRCAVQLAPRSTSRACGASCVANNSLCA